MTASPALLKAIQNLGNKYPHVRAQAVKAIADSLSHRNLHEVNEEVRVAVRCLAEHLTDSDEDTAAKACSCLELTGPAALTVFPELAQACVDRRHAVGLKATNALLALIKINAQTRKKAVEILPILVEGLMEMQPDVVSQAAAIFRSVEQEAEPFIKRLVKEYLVPEPHGTLERMRETFTGYYEKRRRRCFELLGKIGPVAAPALPALKGFLQNEDPELQQLVRSCLIRIRRSGEG
jgi:hypothetical protein